MRLPSLWLFVGLISLLEVVNGAVYPGGNQACNGRTRVRRSWTSLSSTDKRLFRDAVGDSMKNGLFMEFVNLHMEKRGNLQSHYTSAFVYWHRSLTLAFENMLRSLKPAYRCLTIPYWPVFDEYARQASKACSPSLHGCSPAINEICGSPTKSFGEYTYRRLMINGRQAEGACYNTYPCNNAYMGCALRGNVDTTPLPPLSSFGSITNLFVKNSYGEFARSLLGGVHGAIHSSVKGYMYIFASPADPIFYLWHATVDMIAASYHDCKVGRTNMAKPEVKKSSPYTYQKFQIRANVPAPPGTLDSLLMYNRNEDLYQLHDPRTTNSRIAQFFAPYGNTIWKIADTRTIDDYSYEYAYLPSWQANILKKPFCPFTAGSARRRLSLVVEKNVTESTSTTNPTSSSISNPTTGSTFDSIHNPTAGSMSNPTTGSMTDPTTGSSSDPTAGSTAGPTSNPSTSPTTGSMSGPTSGSISGSAIGSSSGSQSEENASSSGSSGSLDNSSAQSLEGSSFGSISGSTGSNSNSSSGSVSGFVSTSSSDSNSGSGSGTESESESGVVPIEMQSDYLVDETSTNIPGKEYHDWYEKVTEKLDEIYPNDVVKQAQELDLMECVSFRQLYGSRDYVAPFLKGQNTSTSRCQQNGDEVFEGKKNTSIIVVGYKPEDVKIAPGVKPAKPISGMRFPPVIPHPVPPVHHSCK